MGHDAARAERGPVMRYMVTLDGHPRAHVCYAEDAAAFCAFLGEGSEIRVAGIDRALWVEGAEQQEASESYDYVAAVVADREASARRGG